MLTELVRELSYCTLLTKLNSTSGRRRTTDLASRGTGLHLDRACVKIAILVKWTDTLIHVSMSIILNSYGCVTFGSCKSHYGL